MLAQTTLQKIENRTYLIFVQVFLPVPGIPNLTLHPTSRFGPGEESGVEHGVNRAAATVVRLRHLASTKEAGGRGGEQVIYVLNVPGRTVKSSDAGALKN